MLAAQSSDGWISRHVASKFDPRIRDLVLQPKLLDITDDGKRFIGKIDGNLVRIRTKAVKEFDVALHELVVAQDRRKVPSNVFGEIRRTSPDAPIDKDNSLITEKVRVFRDYNRFAEGVSLLYACSVFEGSRAFVNSRIVKASRFLRDEFPSLEQDVRKGFSLLGESSEGFRKCEFALGASRPAASNSIRLASRRNREP